MSFQTFWTLLVFVCGSADASDLTLRIAADPAPAGGATQIRIYSNVPVHITSGAFAIDLDQAVFGDIQSVAVLSAAGDAWRLNSHRPPAASASFPAFPSYHRRAGALGRARRPDAQRRRPPGHDLYHRLAVLARRARRQLLGHSNSGHFRAAGDLSVSRVSPASGMLPPSARLVNSKRIEPVRDAPAELTGKRLRVRNPEGEPVERFLGALPSPSPHEPTTLRGATRIVLIVADRESPPASLFIR